MKDQLGNDLTIGATVVYSQSNHSTTPLIGHIVAVSDETVVIATQTHRTIVRSHWDVIVYKGDIK